MAKRALAEVDWAKIDALTDHDIERAIAGDRDTFDVSTIRDEEWQIHYPLPDLKALRQRLGMSQKDFALTFRVSKRTLENWEQGRRTFDGVVSVYLALVAAFPMEVAKLLNTLDRNRRRAEAAAAE
jgi:DNA-binding transcriptional regulator YiaG